MNVATVSECEACFTPDVCRLRGTCDHYAASKLRVAPAASGEQRCQCGERLASECDEEWGPNCDLGNNPKYARGAPQEEAAAVDRALGIRRADEVQMPVSEGTIAYEPQPYEPEWISSEPAYSESQLLAYAAAREAAALERVRGVLRELLQASDAVHAALNRIEADQAEARCRRAVAAARAELGGKP